jgi:hypothetical protein
MLVLTQSGLERGLHPTVIPVFDAAVVGAVPVPGPLLVERTLAMFADTAIIFKHD